MENINIFAQYCAPNYNINEGTPNISSNSFSKNDLTASNLNDFIILNY